MQTANLAPEDVAHLPRRRGGGEDDGGGVAGEEPEDSDGGGEAFAEPVAGFHRNPAVVADGLQHLFLLAPELDAEDIAGEEVGGAEATIHNQAVII